MNNLHTTLNPRRHYNGWNRQVKLVAGRTIIYKKFLLEYKYPNHHLEISSINLLRLHKNPRARIPQIIFQIKLIVDRNLKAKEFNRPNEEKNKE